MRTTRLRLNALAALALLTPLASACSGSPDGDAVAAGDTTTTTTVEEGRALVMQYVQQPPTVGSRVCSPEASCVIPFSLLGQASGDLEGTAVQAGAAATLPDGTLYANSTLVFTGSIAGCGTGTVAMRSTGLNEGGETSGLVEIVDGSGTGDLAAVSGRGTVTLGRAEPGGGGIAHGTIEFTLDC
jgi:Protein of unknown function (DUF3224)